MKRKLYIIIAFSLAFVGCEDFLEVTPEFGASVNEYYSNEEELQVALTACYDPLSAQFDRLYGLGIDAIGMYASDLAISGRTNPRDFSPFENNLQTGNEEVLLIIWRSCYSGIYRCNIFLDRVETVELEAETKARMIAQAHFLRGYYHFELMKVFGGVPVVTSVLTVPESYVARDTREAVVNQIIADFSASIPDLPLKSQWGAANAGRITKGTAQAYLTKLYVYEKRWEDAVATGAEVINSGEYALHDEYFDNFQIEHENGIESILEVQCTTGSATGEGNAHYDLEAFEDTPNPRGYTAPLRNFTDSFQDNANGDTDPRKDNTVSFNIISITLFGTVKYTRPQDPQPASQFDGELNYKLMRYSDFLLLYAEALNESGNSAQALTYINQVRQRPSVNMLPLQGLSQQQTREAIYDERMWELGLEGHRFFDLVRWGIAGDVIRGLGRTFVDGVHELMPIPLVEIGLNPDLTQNPGY